MLDETVISAYKQNMRSVIKTSNQITILLGKQQAKTGERVSLRKLAAIAEVPKDFIYRLDAGEAHHVDLESLARLCDALHCTVQDILILERADGKSL